MEFMLALHTELDHDAFAADFVSVPGRVLVVYNSRNQPQ
jgi:hypothetical protein